MILKAFAFYTDGISWITDGWWHLQSVQNFALQLTNQVQIQFTSSSSALFHLWQFLHTIKQVSDTSWVIYSSTQFWHDLTGNSADLVGEGCPPFQMSITSPGCHLCFWPPTINQKTPMTPSWVWLIYWVVYRTQDFYWVKLTHQIADLLQRIEMYKWAAWMKSYVGWGPEEENFVLMEHGSGTVAWGHILALQPGSPNPGPWGFYMEGSLHNWLNHWPLATESTSNLLLSFMEAEWTECSHPLITWLVPWQPAPSLAFSKIHLIYINPKVIERGLLWILRQLYCSHHLGNSRHFRMFVSETATKT